MENNSAFYKSFPFTLIVTIIISAVLWIFLEKMYGVSFALGGITGMFMMSMLHRSSKNIDKQDELTAKRVATRNYFFRYFFYAVILFTAATIDGLDLLTTGIGLFLFKAIFYVVLLLEKRGGDNDGGIS